MMVTRPGIDLVFRRTYSSTDSKTSPLGYGWMHAYESWVEERDDRTYVHVSGEKGATDVVREFGVINSGRSERGSGGSVLERSSAGRYIYISPEGIRHVYPRFRMYIVGFLLVGVNIFAVICALFMPCFGC